MKKNDTHVTPIERSFFVVLSDGPHGRAGSIITLTHDEAAPLLEDQHVRPATLFDCQIAGLVA